MKNDSRDDTYWLWKLNPPLFEKQTNPHFEIFVDFIVWVGPEEYTVSAVLKDTVGELGICFKWALSFKTTKMFETTMKIDGIIIQLIVSNKENQL